MADGGAGQCAEGKPVRVGAPVLRRPPSSIESNKVSRIFPHFGVGLMQPVDLACRLMSPPTM